MSENIQSDTIKSKHCDKEERTSSENGLWNTEVSSNLEYDKQQLFAEKANATFRELCKALENEQDKLCELERRRKQLQEEMLHLKADIEQERKSLNVNIERSVTEKLNALNNAANINDKLTDDSQIVSENLKLNILPACTEEDEQQPVTVRHCAANSGQNIINEGAIE